MKINAIAYCYNSKMSTRGAIISAFHGLKTSIYSYIAHFIFQVICCA